MKKEITIDETLCRRCKVCSEVCPNVIFQAVNDHTSIRPGRIELCFMCGQCMAACPEKAIHVGGLDYDRDFFELPETINSFNALIQTRRSIRAFRDVPIPKELLEQIVNSVTYAPPSFPPLKTEVTVIRDKRLIKESLPHMIDVYDRLMTGLKKTVGRYVIRRETGEKKFHVIQNHIVPLFNAKLQYMKNGTEDAITRNAPVLILFHSNRNSDNYATDIFIALAFALLKAHTLGLGASAIDLIPPAIEKSPVLKQMFKIPEENEVVASMIVGYPKFKYRRAIQRQLKSVTWIDD